MGFLSLGNLYLKGESSRSEVQHIRLENPSIKDEGTLVFWRQSKRCSENLPPDMNYSVVDFGFNAYESTIYIK